MVSGYFVWILIFSVTCLFDNITGSSMSNSYCTIYTNVHVNLTKMGTTRIATRTMEDGETKYSKNMFCSWTLHAAVGNRVIVNVQESDIGTVPDGANCYDHTFAAIKEYEVMDSFNWLKADPGVYYRMCGSQNPLQFTSKDNELIIEFTSNQNNGNHRGIEFVAQSFELGTCPGSTRSGERNGYCYQVFNKRNTWVDAQEICTMQQGNLVTFQDKEEADFVKELALNSSSHEDLTSWSVGLYHTNDTFEWIDESSSSFNVPSNLKELVKQDSTKLCTIMTMDGSIDVSSCYNPQHPFICKSQKDGNSRLFKASITPIMAIAKITSSAGSTVVATVFPVLMVVLLSLKQ